MFGVAQQCFFSKRINDILKNVYHIFADVSKFFWAKDFTYFSRECNQSTFFKVSVFNVALKRSFTLKITKLRYCQLYSSIGAHPSLLTKNPFIKCMKFIIFYGNDMVDFLAKNAREDRVKKPILKSIKSIFILKCSDK